MTPQDGPTESRLNPARLFAAAVAFMIGLHLLVPGAQVLVAPWTWLGVAPAVAGLGLFLWTDAAFRRHGVASGITGNAWAAAIFKQVKVADGKSAGRAALIADGPFRLSRHPMYLGMALVVLGLGLVFGSATPFLVVAVFPAIVDRLHIAPEEAALEAAFGADWRAYASRVRRWI